MVCIGNICRSPIAEGVMRHKIQQNHLDWEVDSAAVESYHIGSPPHRHSQAVCKEHGIDISQQKARLFSASDLKAFDKIYVMAEDVLERVKEISGSSLDTNKVVLFLEEQFPGEQRSVTDPWYGDLEGYYPVYNLIEETCEQIISKYRDSSIKNRIETG